MRSLRLSSLAAFLVFLAGAGASAGVAGFALRQNISASYALGRFLCWLAFGFVFPYLGVKTVSRWAEEWFRDAVIEGEARYARLVRIISEE